MTEKELMAAVAGMDLPDSRSIREYCLSKGNESIQPESSRRRYLGTALGILLTLCIIISVYAVNIGDKTGGRSGADSIETVSLIKDEAGYHMENVGIGSGTRMLLTTEEERGWTLKSGESIRISLESEATAELEIGYQKDGEYYPVSDTTGSAFSNIITAKEQGEYYFYIINLSAEAAVLQGKVAYTSNDLVFREYAGGAVKAKENTVFTLEKLDGVLGDYVIEGIYLCNYTDGTVQKIAEYSKGRTITYQIKSAGAYCVYAVTQEGETINLTDYVATSVEYSVEEGSGGPMLLQ